MKNDIIFVQDIKELNWQSADSYRIVYQAWLFAREFAETIRACAPNYGHIPTFQQFAAGEIDTDNLRYDGYNQRGDHYQFLEQYVMQDRFQHQLFPDDMRRIEGRELIDQDNAFTEYESFVRSLSVDEQLATLVSREQQLQGIFAMLLQSRDWEIEGFGFYRYFLQRHIQLDSAVGGHEQLTSTLLDLDQYRETLGVFWYLRFKVYVPMM